MKRIVITLPYFTEGEAGRITALLDSGGAERVHIRKPGADAAAVAALIEAVPALSSYRGRQLRLRRASLGRHGLCGGSCGEPFVPHVRRAA